MARPGISSASRRRRSDLALLRLVAALAVLLLAVLPHATLAASTLHAATRPSAMTHPHGHHAARQAQAPTPCHDEDDQPGKPGPSMPSCCILGCGLLGSAPALAAGALTARWQRLAPGHALAIAEAAPEPAERPPRRAPL